MPSINSRASNYFDFYIKQDRTYYYLTGWILLPLLLSTLMILTYLDVFMILCLFEVLRRIQHVFGHASAVRPPNVSWIANQWSLFLLKLLGFDSIGLLNQRWNKWPLESISEIKYQGAMLRLIEDTGISLLICVTIKMVDRNVASEILKYVWISWNSIYKTYWLKNKHQVILNVIYYFYHSW